MRIERRACGYLGYLLPLPAGRTMTGSHNDNFFKYRNYYYYRHHYPEGKRKTISRERETNREREKEKKLFEMKRQKRF